MIRALPDSLSCVGKPDRKRQLLGTVQLVLSLVAFLGIGALAGSYWALGHYERQLEIIRNENHREVEYISRMLEQLIYQTADNAGRTAENTKRVTEAAEAAQGALDLAKQVLERKPAAATAKAPAKKAPAKPAARPAPRPAPAPAPKRPVPPMPAAGDQHIGNGQR